MISGLVLAAGLSKRMGRPKQQVMLRGRPMLDYAVRSFLASKAGEVLVVLRPGITWQAPESVKTVMNSESSSGISSSLRAGLKALGQQSEGVVVGLGDKPAVLASTIDRLILSHESSDAGILVPTFHGTRGNPVLFVRSLYPSLLKLQGDEGARALMERIPASVKEVPVDDEGILLDVNTPADVPTMEEVLARLPSDWK